MRFAKNWKKGRRFHSFLTSQSLSPVQFTISAASTGTKKQLLLFPIVQNSSFEHCSPIAGEKRNSHPGQRRSVVGVNIHSVVLL